MELVSIKLVVPSRDYTCDFCGKVIKKGTQSVVIDYSMGGMHSLRACNCRVTPYKIHRYHEQRRQVKVMSI